MSEAPEIELETAIAQLEQSARGGRLSRWDARAVLVPLGRLVLARGPGSVGATVERIRRATADPGAGWSAAVQEELALACAEHVQGTDARYLDLPRFDWGYVLHARDRLEARVVAARLLGEEPPAALWAEVVEADARVRAARRDGAPDPSEP